MNIPEWVERGSLGGSFSATANATGLDDIAQRYGPMGLDECGNGDIASWWDGTGIVVRGDADGNSFGYTAHRDLQTNTGPATGLPIDLDGTRLGWGTTRTAVVNTFGPGIDYDQGTQITVSDGLLTVVFDGDDTLMAVVAGGHCSSGG